MLIRCNLYQRAWSLFLVNGDLRHRFSFYYMVMDLDVFKYTNIATHLLLKMGILVTKLL